MSNRQKPNRSVNCAFFLAGNCRKGAECKFLHNTEPREPSSSTLTSGSNSASSTSTARPVQRQSKKKPCFQWAKGSCLKGDRCPYLHDPEISAQPEDANKLATLAEKVKAEAETTWQFVSGALVTFSAGLSIQSNIAGYDLCDIRIKGFPLDARPEEIYDLFKQQGIDVNSFHLVHIKTSAGTQEADFVVAGEYGDALAAGLDGIEFRDNHLSFEIGQFNGTGGMGAAASRNCDVLTVSWRAPSRRYVAEYLDMETAQAKVQELNGRIIDGRSLRVDINTRPPEVRFRYPFNPNSIRIDNLPATMTDFSVQTLTLSANVRLLKTPGSFYDLSSARQSLYRQLTFIGDLVDFSPLIGPDERGQVSVRARFISWDAAKKGYDSLYEKKLAFLDNGFVRLHLPTPLIYTITMPAQQYEAQKQQWENLVANIKDKKACNLAVERFGIDRKALVKLRLSGSVKQAVGALKVRVESLAAGEKIPGWHISFSSPTNPFLRRLNQQSGIFVKADWVRHNLKAYGNVKQVQMEVEAELERLGKLEWTMMVDKRSIGFFIRHGIKAMNETFGENTVSLHPASRKITARGGDEVKHKLETMIRESLNSVQSPSSVSSNDNQCPVCSDEVSSAHQLGCGHVYCTPCLRHLLANAADVRSFPLLCIGNDDTCRKPISIPTIQNFLPFADFAHLLETVFVDYIEKHPNEFRYCRTPDCTQLYRCTPNSATAVSCPSCFTVVCSSCHEEGHEGMTCEAAKLQHDPDHLSDIWMVQQGGRVKKCPKCNVYIEKLEGCNHVACRCGAHICWRCMGTFTSETIYPHMQSVHGGIHGGEPQNPIVTPDVGWQANIDLVEQQRLMLQGQRNLERRRIAEENARALRRELVRRQIEMVQPQHYYRPAPLNYEAQARQRRMEEAARIREAQQAPREPERSGWGCTIM
ncbi:hypothetical protein C8J56DRAFT_1055088 [Mycena floridula]|nr:hypothetical protein C8J56DRAFT_1055088 [Mycena floridula]